MKYQFVGNSPSLAYLAIHLAEEVPTAEIEWHTTGFSSSRLRPLRLRPRTLSKLRRIFSKHGISVQFLADAPEMQAWSPASGELGGSVFFEGHSKSDSDRWVDGLDLSLKLRALAQACGVKCIEKRPFAYPIFESSIATVVDVSPSETLSWPPPAGLPEKASDQLPVIYCHEVWFPKGRFDEGNFLQFAEIERLKLLLEPHPSQGFVLSLFSASKPLLDRLLGQLKKANGVGPLPWQALFLLNPGARENSFEVRPGTQRRNLPGIFKLGRTIGQYAPFGNVQDSESFLQSERLLPFLTNVGKKHERAELLALSDRWNRRESTRFEAQYRQAQLWEFLVFSKRFQKSFLQFSAKLPRGIRDLLRSPL